MAGSTRGRAGREVALTPPVGVALLGPLARRPGLWPTAVVVGWRMAAPGWWRRWPPRPWPDEAYLHYRLRAMYGPAEAGASLGADLVGYLEWCRRRPGRSR